LGNDYAMTTTQLLTNSYYDGLTVCVKFDTDATDQVTLNINGMGAKQVYYQNGDPFDDALANIPYNLVYESTHDFFTI